MTKNTDKQFFKSAPTGTVLHNQNFLTEKEKEFSDFIDKCVTEQDRDEAKKVIEDLMASNKISLENDKNESAVNGKNEDGNNPPIEILLKFNQELTSELRKKMKKMLGESEPIAADFHEKGSSSNFINTVCVAEQDRDGAKKVIEDFIALNSENISTFKILLESDKNESAVNGKNEDGNNPPIETALKTNEERTVELRKKMLGESEPIATDVHEKGSSSNFNNMTNALPPFYGALYLEQRQELLNFINTVCVTEQDRDEAKKVIEDLMASNKISLENDKNESAVNGKNEDGNNPPIEILLKFNQELTSELRKKMKKMLGESEPIAADFHEKGSSSNEEQNVSSVDGKQKDKLPSNKSDPEVPPAEQDNNNKKRPYSGPIKLRLKRDPNRFPSSKLVSKDDIGLNYS